MNLYRNTGVHRSIRCIFPPPPIYVYKHIPRWYMQIWGGGGGGGSKVVMLAWSACSSGADLGFESGGSPQTTYSSCSGSPDLNFSSLHAIDQKI